MGTFAGNATLRDDRGLGRGYAVTFPSLDAQLAIRLPSGTSFAGKTHLDLRVRNNGIHPAQIEAAVSSGNGAAWLSSRFVVGVGETLDVSVPFAIPETYGLRALPTISDAARSQSKSAGTVVPSSVQTLYLWNKAPETANVSLEIVEATTHTVPLVGVTDAFGQQRIGKWPGKVQTVLDLQAARRNDPTLDAYPYAADAYGGVLGGRNLGAGPGFRLEKTGGRWVFVTPLGNRFFSMGVNEVGAQAWTPVTGRESLFGSLAALKSQYPAHFTTRNGRVGYVPYALNLQRKYGATWREKAEAVFARRLKSWGFNTLGLNSWDSMIAAKGVPSTFGGSVVGPHRSLAVYDGRAIHDVFDPLFRSSVRRTIQERMIATGGNHEASVGIFLDNEMPWGDRFRTAEPRYRYGLAFGALNAPADQPAHAALKQRLTAKYGTVGSLNAAWGTNFASWAALDSGPVALPTPLSVANATDFANFARDFATQYFSVVREELTGRGYKGPYLGCRFGAAECPPEVLDVAVGYVDVLSFNVYHARPSTVIPFAKEIDHPVLISEFAFGANDLGRVGVPYYPTLTDRARIDSVAEFVNDVKGWPNLVGAHWYRWEDLPVTGKEDFDNAALGLHSIADVPYSKFISQMRLGSLSIMEMLRQLG
jgi:hypothetical protein